MEDGTVYFRLLDLETAEVTCRSRRDGILPDEEFLPVPFRCIMLRRLETNPSILDVQGITQYDLAAFPAGETDPEGCHVHGLYFPFHQSCHLRRPGDIHPNRSIPVVLQLAEFHGNPVVDVRVEGQDYLFHQFPRLELEDFVGHAHLVDELAVSVHLDRRLGRRGVLDDDGGVAPVYEWRLRIAVVGKSHANEHAEDEPEPVAQEVKKQVDEIDLAFVVVVIHVSVWTKGDK